MNNTGAIKNTTKNSTKVSTKEFKEEYELDCNALSYLHVNSWLRCITDQDKQLSYACEFSNLWNSVKSTRIVYIFDEVLDCWQLIKYNTDCTVID